MAKKAKFEWMQYPTPDQSRCGIKVSWNYYKDETKAREAANTAKHNAVLQLQQGYDFGYCSPGSVRQCPKEGFFPGLWEVCLP